MAYDSSNNSSRRDTQQRIEAHNSYRDGIRSDWVDQIFNVIYPGTVLFSIFRWIQFDHLDLFLALEAPNILKAVLSARLFFFWWVWKTLTVIFTPSYLIIKTGWRTITLDAKERYGFSYMPLQEGQFRQSRYLRLTHHVLLEHRSHGTLLLGNVYGELVARQMVSKLQGIQTRIKTLKVTE